MGTILGVDVSHHQGDIDWERVAKGHRFVFLKATEGLTFTDSRYDQNRREAREAGLLVGAYHYASPSRPAVDQADRFVRVAGEVDLPHVLDLESGTGNQDRWALDFLRRVEKLTGRAPILYSYAPHIKAHLSSSELARFPLWLAAYRVTPPSAPRPWQRWTFWQHTSSGTAAGIKGRVDLNHFAGTPADLDALAGIDPRPAPTPYDEQEGLLMAVAKDDDDARRAMVRTWFHDYLGRGPLSVDEMNLHVLVLAVDGADRCLAGIVDSEEAQDYRARRTA